MSSGESLFNLIEKSADFFFFGFRRAVLRARLTAVGVAALSAVSLIAHAADLNEIVELNRLKTGLHDISWCSDDTLIATSEVSVASAVLPPKAATVTTVNLVSLSKENVSTLLTYQNVKLSANCLRNGEYIFVSSIMNMAASDGQRGIVTARAAQIIDISPSALAGRVPRVDTLLLTRAFFREAPRSAADGSFYGEMMNSEVFLGAPGGSDGPPAREKMTYSVSRGDVVVTSVATSPTRGGASAPAIYGIGAAEIINIGDFRCARARPNCNSDQAGSDIVYYTYSRQNRGDRRLDLLFTVSPGGNVSAHRWPIAAKAGLKIGPLPIAGVALDGDRCFILFKSSETDSAHGTAGRGTTDLYLSRCRFHDDVLEYDEPKKAGAKSGSFDVRSMEIKGDHLVISETSDLPATPQDRAKMGAGVANSSRACIHFFELSAGGGFAPTNSVCAQLGSKAARRLLVSPSGRSIAVDSDTRPMIVGRDYRNGGNGPDWLGQGE